MEIKIKIKRPGKGEVTAEFNCNPNELAILGSLIKSENKLKHNIAKKKKDM